jgi:hypothetical protein
MNDKLLNINNLLNISNLNYGLFCQQPLRRLDPEQREDGRLQHPAQGPDHVRDVHRELDGDPGDFQASLRTGLNPINIILDLPMEGGTTLAGLTSGFMGLVKPFSIYKMSNNLGRTYPGIMGGGHLFYPNLTFPNPVKITYPNPP